MSRYVPRVDLSASRVWRLTSIACILGASIICIDVLVRYIPGKKNFKIQESNGFLAASMSLSFGVMVGCRCTILIFKADFILAFLGIV